VIDELVQLADERDRFLIRQFKVLHHRQCKVLNPREVVIPSAVDEAPEPL